MEFDQVVTAPRDLADLAMTAARLAATDAAARRRGGLILTTKSSATDLVTDADRAAEAIIVEHLLAARPRDGVLGEEGAERPGSSGVRWIIDPIDGTTNFVYDQWAWGVSIGAEVDGRVVAGVVVVPGLDSEFHAADGEGAYEGDRLLQLAQAAPLATSLVGTGFSYDADRRGRQGQMTAKLLPHVRDIRRMGAASLDLCAVASGRLDCYFEAGLAPWDLAAGGLIATEAGASVTSLAGTPLPVDPSSDTVVACHPERAEALIALLNECGAQHV